MRNNNGWSQRAVLSRLAPAFARFREQRCLALQPHPLGHFVGVVETGRIAAAVAQPMIVERAAWAARHDRLDLRALVVAGRQIEAHRPPAARAILAVAAP